RGSKHPGRSRSPRSGWGSSAAEPGSLALLRSDPDQGPVGMFPARAVVGERIVGTTFLRGLFHDSIAAPAAADPAEPAARPAARRTAGRRKEALSARSRLPAPGGRAEGDRDQVD